MVYSTIHLLYCNGISWYTESMHISCGFRRSEVITSSVNSWGYLIGLLMMKGFESGSSRFCEIEWFRCMLLFYEILLDYYVSNDGFRDTSNLTLKARKLEFTITINATLFPSFFSLSSVLFASLIWIYFACLLFLMKVIVVNVKSDASLFPTLTTTVVPRDLSFNAISSWNILATWPINFQRDVHAHILNVHCGSALQAQTASE